MPVYCIDLSDTITFERHLTLEVEADDEDSAREKVLANADELMGSYSDAVIEEQVDNTPYEADIDGCPAPPVPLEHTANFQWKP